MRKTVPKIGSGNGFDDSIRPDVEEGVYYAVIETHEDHYLIEVEEG